MNLALKDVQHNFSRFAMTAFGLGMMLMIVMGMAGIYRGLIEDATLIVERIGADGWVVQKDTRGPFAEISRIPKNVVDRIRSVPGIQTSREFVFHTIQRDRGGKLLRMSVLGLSWPSDKGEWLPIIAGRTLSQNHFEMIVDKSLGFEISDKIKLGKEFYTVVGLTKGMVSSGGDGMITVTMADSQAIQFDNVGESVRIERSRRENRSTQVDLYNIQPPLIESLSGPAKDIPALPPHPLSAVVFGLKPGVEFQDVKKTISAWGDITVYSKEDQKNLLLQGMVDKARRQLGMFRVLLTIIAAVIMSLILYTLTLDKLHSIALLKLLGAPNKTILALLLQQALVLGFTGYIIAYLLGKQLFPYFPRRVVVSSGDLMQLAFIVFLISILSSLLGIWRALKVQPTEALMG